MEGKAVRSQVVSWPRDCSCFYRGLRGLVSAQVRVDMHGFAWIFGTLQGAALPLIERRALIWRAGDLPVGEQISLWRALDFAVAFGVSRHVEVGLKEVGFA